jgi:hypothetical protein
MATSRGILGAGVVVSPAPGATQLAIMRWRTARGTGPTAALPRNAELVAGNAMEACLPFLEAIAVARPRSIRIGISPSMSLDLDLEFAADHG